MTFASGKMRVLMDSDSCNEALNGSPDTVDVPKEQNPDVLEKGEDENEGGSSPSRAIPRLLQTNLAS